MCATYLFDSVYNNAFKLGGYVPSSTGGPNGPLIKAEEMWNLDMKMDDGKPNERELFALKDPLCL